MSSDWEPEYEGGGEREVRVRVWSGVGFVVALGEM